MPEPERTHHPPCTHVLHGLMSLPSPRRMLIARSRKRLTPQQCIRNPSAGGVFLLISCKLPAFHVFFVQGTCNGVPLSADHTVRGIVDMQAAIQSGTFVHLSWSVTGHTLPIRFPFIPYKHSLDC